MSVDRYLAVCHPIRSMAWRTVGLSRVICACIWLTSLLVMLPIILHATVYEDEEGVRSCTLTWHSPSVDPWTAFIIYTCLLGFAAPVSLISVFYTLVVCRLRRPRPAPSSISSKQRDKSRNRITRLVLVIIAVYVTCWLPYWIFQVGLTMRVFTDLPPWGYTIYQAITVLSYANSMLNPLLYVFLTEKFRQNLTAACCCSAKQLQQQGNATKAKVNKEQTETFLSPENKQVTMLDSVNTQDSRITGHSALHYSRATTISELSSPTVL